MTAPDNPNLTTRLYYAELGLPTFVGRWKKLPSGKWDKVGQLSGKAEGRRWMHTLDPAEIEDQVRRFPNAPVGIAYERSGFFALDLDQKDGKDGLRWLREAEAEYGDLPDTPTFLTPSGGEQRIFRVPEDYEIPRNTESKIAPGVDIRGEGGMSFVPPTVRPDGKAYEWKPGLSPDEVGVTDAPEWLIEAVLEAAGSPAAARDDDPLLEQDPEKQAKVGPMAETIARNELKLLQLLEGKSNTLDARDDWRNLGFGLADVFKGTSYKDWALQVFVDWSLRWEPPNGKQKPSDEALIADAKKVWASEKRKRGAVTVKTAQMLISQMADLPPDPALLEDVSEIAPKEGVDDLSDIVLPGLLGELQGTLQRGNERDARILPIAGAFVAQAALIGPYVTLKAEDGSTPLNLFVTIFADTGAGKSTVRAVSKTLLKEAERGSELQTDPSSASGVHQTAIDKEGVFSVIQDEAGRKKSENKASSNPHAAGSMTAMMDVYGNEQLGIEEKTYSNARDKKRAVAPIHLTFLRMSQRETYLNAAGELDSASGELNRFLIFPEKETLDLRGDPPDRDGLYELGPLGAKAAAMFRAPVPTTRFELTMTPEALEVYNDFGRTDCEDAYREGGYVRQSWVRAKLHVKRFAAHIAFSAALEGGLRQVDGKPVLRGQVEAEHMALAIRIVRACLIEVAGVAKRATDGDREAWKDKIEDFIRKEIREGRGVGPGGQYVKYSVITDKVTVLKHISQRDKDDLFTDMVKSERLVDYVERKGRGRPATLYALRKRGD